MRELNFTFFPIKDTAKGLRSAQRRHFFLFLTRRVSFRLLSMAEQEEEDDEEIQLKESYTIERLNQRTTKDISRAIVKSCLMILEQK